MCNWSHTFLDISNDCHTFIYIYIYMSLPPSDETVTAPLPVDDNAVAVVSLETRFRKSPAGGGYSRRRYLAAAAAAAADRTGKTLPPSNHFQPRRRSRSRLARSRFPSSSSSSSSRVKIPSAVRSNPEKNDRRRCARSHAVLDPIRTRRRVCACVCARVCDHDRIPRQVSQSRCLCATVLWSDRG